MKNTFGNAVSVTLFGESHGEAVGAVLDGLAPGIRIDEAYIRDRLSLRRPQGDISTSRREADEFRIVSGVFRGVTTGTPVCVLIPNADTKSADYEKTRALARPGHADYTANVKYHGFQDYRGGGHFSGRVTAALVAAGAVAMDALCGKGILIGTHIKSCAGIADMPFCDIKEEIASLNSKAFAVIDEAAGLRMKEAIAQAAKENDSVGGVLETAVIGLPAGVGEPWFDTVEGVLSHALFSVPAIKGVSFGAGFDFANMRGSTANDAFYMDNGIVKTKTNHNGGVNGGITNGMPLVFSCAVKPTPSIGIPQRTVDMEKGENAGINVRGRHDPAIVHRARAVVDSVTALALCDLLAQRFGTDWLGGAD